MRRIAIVLLLLLAAVSMTAQEVLVPDAEQLVGAPSGPPLQEPALTQRTQEVAGGIRCPVCQGLSIADSPSEMAVNMKRQVHSLLARGYDAKQIESYFERSYGQFILLRPKFRGVNSLVWLMPAAALAAGLLIVLATMRRLARRELKEEGVAP